MKNFRKDLSLIYRGLNQIHQLRKGLLTLVILRSIFESIVPFVNIYMSALLINGIIAKYSFNTLLKYIITTVVLNFALILIHKTCHRIISIFETEFNHKIDICLNNKMNAMDYSLIEQTEIHNKRRKIRELANLNSGGLWMVYRRFGELIKHSFSIVFSISITISLFTTVSYVSTNKISRFIASPTCSIILGISIIINTILAMYSNGTMTKKSFELFNQFIPANRIFFYYTDSYLTAYQNGKDVRIYNQQDLLENELHSFIFAHNKTISDMATNQIKYTSITSISTIVISTFVYLFVGLKALAGLFCVGSIVKYVGSINQFINSFTEFMNQFALLLANNQALTAFFDFLDIENTMYQGSIPIEKRYDCISGDNEYEIEFCNVSFKYPDTDIYVLKDISLKFRIGSKLAIVGTNGSGKTTFIKLLCRLYDPTEGCIKLNGIDIRKYDYKEYLSVFSVVFQDFKLFSFPLGQNVGSSLEYDKATVEKYLEQSGFIERYEKMDEGCQTYLYKDFEESGVEVSGGEAQKIALARALYKDSPFIILDEPTAALDPISEYEIYSRFNEVVGDKTAIYISHRLSSCRFCDDIAVFHQGNLIQQGSHEKLLEKKDGQYYKLWHAQAQYYA